ncbi:hypothetical protein CJ197_10935 [Brachybacterium sp. UMB0905]|nr:hypothetical protein CJ197_10935 [Brachybacterium sp. UMB0905]
MNRRPIARTRPMTWQVIVLAVVLIAALLLVSLVVKVRPPARTLPITVTSATWAPYLSEELPGNGPLAQIATEALQGAGYQPEYSFTTWPLAQQAVDDGGALGVIAMVASPERDQRFLYSEPILELRYTLFGRADDDLSHIAERSDLSGLRVARIEGYDYWEELEQSGAEFSTYPTTEDAFAALEDGDVDLVAEDFLAGQAALDGAGYLRDGSEIAEVQPTSALTTSTMDLRMLIRDSAEGRRLRSDFNASLARYRESADYDEHLSELQQGTTAVTIQGEIFDDDDPSQRLGITPQGTPAQVLEWPHEPSDGEARVRVKVLSGPWVGRVVEIRLKDVVITDA